MPKNAGGTYTTHGFIPYKTHKGIDLPVKCVFNGVLTHSQSMSPPEPMMVDGHYVYALPGGGIYVNGDEYLEVH